MKTLYRDGTTRLEQETNLVSIVKKIRHFEIILENSLLNSDQRKFDVAHSMKNIIDLDDDKPGRIMNDVAPGRSSQNNGSPRKQYEGGVDSSSEEDDNDFEGGGRKYKDNNDSRYDQLPGSETARQLES